MPINFDQFNRDYVLRVNDVYVRGFRDRLLPVFDNIDHEADEASERYFHNYMSQPAEDEGDPAGAADRAMERGAEVWMDLHFVRKQLVGLAIAGLYHLWERSLKEFLLREFGLHEPASRERRALLAADFPRLQGILREQGFDIQPLPCFDDIDRLRLIANTIKHGDGRSCEELAQKAPELFDRELFGLQHDHEALNLRREEFDRFNNAVVAFWNSFAEWSEQANR